MMRPRFLAALMSGLLAMAFTSALADVLTPEQDDRLGTATHFGINWDGWNYARLMPMIRQAGFGWIRDEIQWSSVEKEKGKYLFDDSTRAWIKAAHQNHLKLILILNATQPQKGYSDPYDPDAFAAFAAAAAREFKDDVDVFEILNEPSNGNYRETYGGSWNGNGNSPWMAKYVTLMNKAAEAIKAVNPKVKVIGLGSTTPVNFRQLTMGISPAVDGIVDHPYSFRSVPELTAYPGSKGIVDRDGIATSDELGTFSSFIAMFREQSARHKGPKEIWLTEWGYTTYQPNKPQQYAGFSLSAQAKYTQRRMMECMGLGVEVSIQYDFKDDGTNLREPEHHFGLIDSKYEIKPAYEAVRQLVKVMRPFKAAKWGEVEVFPAADRPEQWPIVWDGSKIASPGSVMSYQFADEKGLRALAIWSAERADGDLSPRVARVEIKSDQVISSVLAIDTMTGQQRHVTFSTRGNRVVLDDFTVPDSPVLLTLTMSGTQKVQEKAAAINDQFARPLAWNFHNGAEFPGAKGSFQLVPQDGREVGKLNYDFTGGGEYVVAFADVAIPAQMREFSVKVSGKEPLSVLIRLIDSTDQVHQYVLPYTQAGQKQTMRVDLTQPSPNSWSGANDHRIHAPIKTVSLGVEKTKTAGVAEFTELRWE